MEKHGIKISIVKTIQFNEIRIPSQTHTEDQRQTLLVKREEKAHQNIVELEVASVLLDDNHGGGALALEGDALGLHGGGLIECVRAKRNSVGRRKKRRQNLGDGDLNGGVVPTRVGEEVTEHCNIVNEGIGSVRSSVECAQKP